MMTSPSYKEKELLIMRALLRLLSGGMSIAEIKTSDIAQEAGIGKGTLYNYFDTKEDIFCPHDHLQHRHAAARGVRANEQSAGLQKQMLHRPAHRA